MFCVRGGIGGREETGTEPARSRHHTRDVSVRQSTDETSATKKGVAAILTFRRLTITNQNRRIRI